MPAARSAQGNEDDAIILGSDGNFIGGPTPGARNVISASGRVALFILTSGNVIQGNFIGTQKDGLSPLGNQSGLGFVGGGFADNNTIGGTAAGEANVIAFNDIYGVLAEFSGYTGNAIRGNSIHDNGALGIDLGAGGPHFNDALDADDGPNHLQNFPIVREVEHLGPVGAGSTRIAGKLHSLPSTTFDLDFYCEPGLLQLPERVHRGRDVPRRLPRSRPTATATRRSTRRFRSRPRPAPASPSRPPIRTATPPSSRSGSSSRSTRLPVPIRAAPASTFPVPTSPTRRRSRSAALPATGVAFVNDHQLSATMPAFPPGTSQDVVVTTPDGTTGTLIKGWVSDFLDVPAGPPLPRLRRHARLQRHHRRRGRRQLRRRRRTRCASRWPSSCCRAKYGLCYIPPPCTASLRRRTLLPRSSPPGSRSSSPRASPAAAPAAATSARTTPFSRQPDGRVLCSDAKYGSSYVAPACTRAFSTTSRAEPVRPLDLRPRRSADHRRLRRRPLLPRPSPPTAARWPTFIVKTFGLAMRSRMIALAIALASGILRCRWQVRPSPLRTRTIPARAR